MTTETVPRQTHDRPYVSAAEYARDCGVDPDTVATWYHQGLIPGAWQPKPRATIRIPSSLMGLRPGQY